MPAVGDRRYETYNPYRTMFDVVWSGRRHVMMGATQVDRYGNQNIAGIGGTPQQPRTQLLGFRGAPGNTIHNTTSYWVPAQNPKVFVEAVDIVTGIGYDRAAALAPASAQHHEIRRVVSNLGVFDFETPDHAMRLRSVHPGVTIDEKRIVTSTGATLKPVPLHPENRFHMRAEDLEKAITPECRVLLLNTPHNPTGAVLTLERRRADIEQMIVQPHQLGQRRCCWISYF